MEALLESFLNIFNQMPSESAWFFSSQSRKFWEDLNVSVCIWPQHGQTLRFKYSETVLRSKSAHEMKRPNPRDPHSAENLNYFGIPSPASSKNDKTLFAAADSQTIMPQRVTSRQQVADSRWRRIRRTKPPAVKPCAATGC